MALLKQAMNLLVKPMRKIITYQSPRSLHHLRFHGCSEDEIEKRFVNYFNRCDIDGWDVRQGMNDIMAFDMVPSPEVVVAALYACRRVNDFAMSVRFLESVKDKCGPKVNEIYPWIIQEIQPVLNELGVDTPEQLGYDQPELYLESVFDIH